MNKVQIIGRWTKDLDLKFLPNNGTAVAKGVLAVDRRFKKEGQQSADFLPIVIWGKIGENTATYCGRKGDLLGIAGRIETRNYENKEGNKVYVTEIVAEEVQFLNSKPNNKQANNGNNNSNFEPDYASDVTPIDDGDIPF